MQFKERAITARAGTAALLLACALASAPDRARSAPAEPPALPQTTSAEARAVFEHAKDKLLQIRVIHKGTRAQAATGTGFVASAEGLVLTNYHVVSKLALEPNDYALELECTDGSTETPRLIAIDVANDLAVLATGRRGRGFLPIRPEPLSKGERGFSMGHPLDLGLTIVEGNYNGYIETDGPAVTLDGEVFGVNVARRTDGELVSYLVPSDHAATLLRRAAAQREPPADFRKEVATQLLAQQERLYGQLLAAPMGTIAMGRYAVPDVKAPFVRCWGFPNSSETRLYDEDTRYCAANSDLFVENRLSTGEIQFMHERFEARELGAVRFAARIESAYANNLLARLISSNKKELTAFRCHDGFVSRPAGTLRVALCSRAYKHFAGLYDFVLRAVTVDSSTSALVSTLTLRGVSFETGRRFAQDYVEAISWTN